MKPIIISGGPGAGKTTLINSLGAQGYSTFAEASRRLIEEQSQLKDGVLPWVDLPAFAKLCLAAMSEQKRRASSDEIAFLDRAIPDICGYLEQAGLTVDSDYIDASQGYHSQAFLCRPEASIYVQDDVRPYPFEEALTIHEALVRVYHKLGFEVVEVPFAPIEARTAFILNTLSN